MNNGRMHQATPPGLRAYAQTIFGRPFDTDACASDWNKMEGVSRYFTEQDSFLDHRAGRLGLVWMNCPWQRTPGIGAFVDHMLNLFRSWSVDGAVLLLPTRTGRPWYRTLSEAAGQIVITSRKGRIRYLPPPGETIGKGGSEDCALFVLGHAGYEPGRLYFGPECEHGDIVGAS